MGKLQLLLESVRRKVTAAQQARLKHDSMKSEIANERQKNSEALEQAEQELAHIRNKNQELADFIKDYKNQVSQMESRLQQMEEQRTKQKETIDSLMKENLLLKKEVSQLKG